MNKIKVLFMGRKPVAAKSLNWLLHNEHVEVIGVITDSQFDNSPTKKMAVDNNVPIFDFEDALELMKSGSLSFDLGLSMLYWRKLKDEFISLPTLGTINFHPAPLPHYKGTAGYNMAILDSLNSWGMTAHYVDEEIDTGEIIKVLEFPICKDTETAKSLENKSQTELFDLFVDVVSRTIESNNKLDTKPNVGGKYITRAEMEAMKEIKTGDDIHRKIRAFWFPPYDGAFIKIGDVKFTLTDSYILSTLADSSISNVFSNKDK